MPSDRVLLIEQLESALDYMTAIKRKWEGPGEAPLWLGTNALMQSVASLKGKDIGTIVAETKQRYEDNPDRFTFEDEPPNDLTRDRTPEPTLMISMSKLARARGYAQALAELPEGEIRREGVREGGRIIGRLLRLTCPDDTNGDGDCGKPMCPYCGEHVDTGEARTRLSLDG